MHNNGVRIWEVNLLRLLLTQYIAFTVDTPYKALLLKAMLVSVFHRCW